MKYVIKCKKCGDIIGSTHVHDMIWCSCGAIAIDGGNYYCKITGNAEDVDHLVSEHDKLILEKALKLACDYLTTNQDEYDELTRLVKNIYNDEEYLKTKINYFKTKAKEMMKSE